MWSTSMEVFLISWENWKILLMVFTNVPAHETITINTCGESFQWQLVQWHLQPKPHQGPALGTAWACNYKPTFSTEWYTMSLYEQDLFPNVDTFSHHIITGSPTNKDEAFYYFLTSAATRIEDCPCQITWTNLYLPASRGTDKTTHKYM